MGKFLVPVKQQKYAQTTRDLVKQSMFASERCIIQWRTCGVESEVLGKKSCYSEQGDSPKFTIHIPVRVSKLVLFIYHLFVHSACSEFFTCSHSLLIIKFIANIDKGFEGIFNDARSGCNISSYTICNAKLSFSVCHLIVWWCKHCFTHPFCWKVW